MARRSRSHTLAVLAVTLISCDPVMNIRGRVIDEHGVPQANVSVSLVCPPETWSRVDPKVQTNDAGQFVFDGFGCPTRQCRVATETEDGRSLGVDLAPHCTGSTYHCRDSCPEATVELRPEH